MIFWAIILLLWVAPALLLTIVLVRASAQKRSSRAAGESHGLPAADPKRRRRAPADEAS
jgi:cytochrome c-type biogenesis protein CcmH/NrfF